MPQVPLVQPPVPAAGPGIGVAGSLATRPVPRPPDLPSTAARPSPARPSPARPSPARPSPAAARSTVAPRPDARPRIVEEQGILGLSRRARGRVGSRLFTLFFVFVFGLILIQLVVSLLMP